MRGGGRARAMRVHVVNVLRGTPEVKGQTLDRIAGLARTVEEKGFHGLWVTDSFGRGRPTLDPVVAMTVIATVTKRIEIGTCVLQVPCAIRSSWRIASSRC